MVRITKSASVPSSSSATAWKQYIEASGLSTDTKPDDCATGSIFVEVDTGKVFLYDEEGADDERWTEQFSFQS